MTKLPPQERRGTETSRHQVALYCISTVVTLVATFDPTWPKWQAVAMALLLGSSVATAIRDGWWRKELHRTSDQTFQAEAPQP